MSLTEKEIYDLNNRNVASQNVQLGTILSNQAGNPLTEKEMYDLTNDNVITQKVEFGKIVNAIATGNMSGIEDLSDEEQEQLNNIDVSFKNALVGSYVQEIIGGDVPPSPEPQPQSATLFHILWEDMDNYVFTIAGLSDLGKQMYDNDELTELVFPRTFSIDENKNIIDGDDYSIEMIGGVDDGEGYSFDNNLDKITRLVFLDNIKKVQSGFGDCPNLEKIEIYNPLFSIGSGFGNSTKIMETSTSGSDKGVIYLNVNTNDKIVFSWDNNLMDDNANIIVSDSAKYLSRGFGCKWDADTGEEYYNEKIKTFTSNNIAYIGGLDLPNATQFNFGNATRFGKWAFINSNLLTSIYAPNVNYLEGGMFDNELNPALTSLTISNNPVYLGGYCFKSRGLAYYSVNEGDYNVEYAKVNGNDKFAVTGQRFDEEHPIELPDYTTIPEGVFIPNSAFLSTEFKNITLTATFNKIGDSTFSECQLLNSVTITNPNDVKYIESYAFANCENLTSFTIPSNVEKIGDGAFTGCYELVDITLPSTIKEIGQDAFAGNASTLTCLAVEPPKIVSFYSNPIYEDEEVDFLTIGDFSAIYVPAQSVDAYKTNKYWAKYASIIQPIQA